MSSGLFASDLLGALTGRQMENEGYVGSSSGTGSTKVDWMERAILIEGGKVDTG